MSFKEVFDALKQAKKELSDKTAATAASTADAFDALEEGSKTNSFDPLFNNVAKKLKEEQKHREVARRLLYDLGFRPTDTDHETLQRIHHLSREDFEQLKSAMPVLNEPFSALISAGISGTSSEPVSGDSLRKLVTIYHGEARTIEFNLRQVWPEAEVTYYAVNGIATQTCHAIPLGKPKAPKA